MDTSLPTPADIKALLSYLPMLCGEEGKEILTWKGGTPNKDGLISSWPEYAPAVEEFFSAASSPCWSDHHYDAAQCSEMLSHHGRVFSASLQEVKSMLTYCVRGERFCDGHWGTMIEQGHIGRLLARLQALCEP